MEKHLGLSIGKTQPKNTNDKFCYKNSMFEKGWSYFFTPLFCIVMPSCFINLSTIFLLTSSIRWFVLWLCVCQYYGEFDMLNRIMSMHDLIRE